LLFRSFSLRIDEVEPIVGKFEFDRSGIVFGRMLMRANEVAYGFLVPVPSLSVRRIVAVCVGEFRLGTGDHPGRGEGGLLKIVEDFFFPFLLFIIFVLPVHDALRAVVGS
jgi:hypothetical protein